MNKLDLRKYQCLYLILQKEIFDKSDTFKTMTEFQTFIIDRIPDIINDNIRLINTQTEVLLNATIRRELGNMRLLCTPDLFAFNPEVDGAKVKRRSSSNKVKRKNLSNKRRLSGRGSRYRAVISRRRR
jgi:hypothetical protein